MLKLAPPRDFSDDLRQVISYEFDGCLWRVPFYYAMGDSVDYYEFRVVIK